MPDGMKQYFDSAPLASLFVISLHTVTLLACFPLLCAHRKLVCLGIEYLKRKRQVSPMYGAPPDI